jgi:hypothetical protein
VIVAVAQIILTVTFTGAPPMASERSFLIVASLFPNAWRKAKGNSAGSNAYSASSDMAFSISTAFMQPLPAARGEPAGARRAAKRRLSCPPKEAPRQACSSPSITGAGFKSVEQQTTWIARGWPHFQRANQALARR